MNIFLERVCALGKTVDGLFKIVCRFFCFDEMIDSSQFMAMQGSES